MIIRQSWYCLRSAPLFAAGQGRDNMVSMEDVVIKDTFQKIRTALEKH
jgi:hypothetical protein